MYIKNVSEDHRPSFMIVVSSWPLSLSAMAPPARKECTPIRSGSMPCSCRFRSFTAWRRVLRSCVDVMLLHWLFSK